MPNGPHGSGASRAEGHLRRLADERWAGRSWVQAVLRRPHGVLALPWFVRHLPALPLHEVDDEAEAHLRQALRIRSPLRRALLRGALYAVPLPTEPSAYTRGRAMSLMRNHANVAVKRGIVAERVDDPAERRSVLKRSQRFERDHPRPQYRGSGDGGGQFLTMPLWMVARDADGVPLVLGVVDLQSRIAVLRYFRVMDEGDDASRARYLLMQELARRSIEAGADHLVSDTAPIYVSPGLHYFMQRVGFKMFRLPRRGSASSGDLLRRPAGAASVRRTRD